MAVKIRLTRRGKKRQPTYRVVVADSRSPRDGRFIEQIGRYDPRQEPSLIEIDGERAAYWLSQGAQPSDQVRKLLEISGALEARPVKDRRVHVVGEEDQRRAEAEAAAEAAIEVVEDVDDEEAAAPEAEVEEPEASEQAPEAEAAAEGGEEAEGDDATKETS
jgi:small subunit ribosomal protein S16